MTHKRSETLEQVTGRHREIINDLIGKLLKVDIDARRPLWTEAVKKIMQDLCANKYMKSIGMEYCATCTVKKIRYHEWLLDVVWYLNTEEEEAIVLALESEWDNKIGCVRDDFAKLLAVKAPIKILLFEAGKKSRNTAEAHMRSLTQVSRKWRQHSEGDMIYVINFRDGGYEAHFYRAPGDGWIPDLTFLPMSERPLTGTES